MLLRLLSAAVRADSMSPSSDARVPGDHQLFVGRNHPADTRLPAREIRGPVAGVGVLVELDAEPGRGLADAPADLGGVLADAGGEHEAVDAAQHRGERADLLGRAVDEVVDGEARALARCSPSRSRMSLLMPEMPSRPDFL